MIQSIFYKTHRTSSALVGLFMFLFIMGQGALSDTVLCFGADGHVAEEAAYRGRCGEPSNVMPREIARFPLMREVPLPQDHCGPCFDLTILGDSVDQRYIPPTQNTTSQIKTLLISNLASAPFTLVATTTEVLQPITPSFINPTLASLRTVTLLI